ncbi:MAG: malate/lactate/ureidoglycolate dehydrogenase [Alphaproteobacteria bacterium]
MAVVLGLRADNLEAYVAAIFRALGSDGNEAHQVAAHLVDANLTGHDSHGVARIPRYVGYARDGLLTFNARPKLLRQSATLAVLDGDGGLGQAIGHRAVAEGVARARQSGVALVALTNVGHLGRIGAWAELAAADGMASLHFVNTTGAGMRVAPFGGSDARLSTNPIVIGLPRQDAPPVIHDAATSFIAEGKAMVARSRGEPVPDGALYDAAGRPTRDPAALYTEPPGALTAFGLHKGSGLSVMVDLLAGALTGGGSTRAGVRRLANNMLSVFIRPDGLGDQAAYEAEVGRFLHWVASSRPLVPGHRVLLPGEVERETRERRRRDGIPMDEASWAAIGQAAQDGGLAAAENERLRAAVPA